MAQLTWPMMMTTAFTYAPRMILLRHAFKSNQFLVIIIYSYDPLIRLIVTDDVTFWWLQNLSSQKELSTKKILFDYKMISNCVQKKFGHKN